MSVKICSVLMNCRFLFLVKICIEYSSYFKESKSHQKIIKLLLDIGNNTLFFSKSRKGR